MVEEHINDDLIITTAVSKTKYISSSVSVHIKDSGTRGLSYFFLQIHIKYFLKFTLPVSNPELNRYGLNCVPHQMHVKVLNP